MTRAACLPSLCSIAQTVSQREERQKKKTKTKRWERIERTDHGGDEMLFATWGWGWRWRRRRRCWWFSLFSGCPFSSCVQGLWCHPWGGEWNAENEPTEEVIQDSCRGASHSVHDKLLQQWAHLWIRGKAYPRDEHNENSLLRVTLSASVILKNEDILAHLLVPISITTGYLPSQAATSTVLT